MTIIFTNPNIPNLADRLLEAGTLLENDTFRGIFATYPHKGTSVGPQLLDQVVGTFLLMLIVCSLIDTNNSAPPPGNLTESLC